VVYIAVIDEDKGGWKQPKEGIGWINIPSPDKKIITQIPLAPPEIKDTFKKDEYAVFGCSDTKDSENKYRFYGIFRIVDVNKQNCICIWNRISPTLYVEDWK
jgi:hypothetical protein